MTDVTQADREAAAALQHYYTACRMNAGDLDDSPFVQAFARHRAAGYAAGLEDAAKRAGETRVAFNEQRMNNENTADRESYHAGQANGAVQAAIAIHAVAQAGLMRTDEGVIPKNMKRHTGHRRPDDYNGGPVLQRDGSIFTPRPQCRSWLWNRRNAKPISDIVAYIPRAEPSQLEKAWRDGWAECKARLTDDAAFDLTEDVEQDAWLDSATRETLDLRQPDAFQVAISAIAKAAHAIGWQAGVGGRETAGAIVSYLATSPDEIGPFFAGELSPLDFAGDWMRGGCLTWHGADGKVWSPEEAAAARAAKTAGTGLETPVDR